MAAETRNRRSKEERMEELNQKILFHKEQIGKLEEKKRKLTETKKRRQRMTTAGILQKAKKKGLTVKEIARLLGLDGSEEKPS
ncbi:MAG: hypothetical protein LKJ86_04810 [Oscillibacter sp.]|jgi:AraC-like DNA-binding protein|nr:hypothetical protein [Oscillibacter sp.]